LGVRLIAERGGRVEISFGDTPNVTDDGLVKARELFPGKLSFLPGPPDTMRLATSRLNLPLIEVLTKLLTCLSGVTDSK
jgi:transcription-repair coupling factor (superfamily II helicase)